MTSGGQVADCGLAVNTYDFAGDVASQLCFQPAMGYCFYCAFVVCFSFVAFGQVYSLASFGYV